jgi:predicted dienelactone hydrolase
VRTVDIIHRNQIDILKFDMVTGKAPLYDRPLKLEVWYPAVIPPGKEEKTTSVSAMFRTQNTGGTFDIAGKALHDAPPAGGQRFPLVIVSHGYPGSRTFLSYLTENLASKGYVVAAIDHTDSVFGEVRPFSGTLLNRANDQLFTIESIGALFA